ncbi:MAG: septal ring lytic transglycosylase RlpA family protein [Rhodospirillales bacterium]|nr:septal ring lytic transglycosylase RlpA family protein [Rhodospirillales bacterium]
MVNTGKILGRLAAALILTGLLAACSGLGGERQAYAPGGKVVETQVGMASWYGDRFHGRKTASGQRFDMHALTAAHRSLPFGTRVRVINLANNRVVVVTINDRGPFVRGRIIDLSKRAAEVLGYRQKGVTKVRVEVLKTASG